MAKYRSKWAETRWVDVGVGGPRRVEPGEVLEVPDQCPYDFPDEFWEPVNTHKKAAPAADKE